MHMATTAGEDPRKTTHDDPEKFQGEGETKK